MKAFCYENEIVVFWYPVKLSGEYSISLNGKTICLIDKTFCRISGLTPNTEYEISISLINKKNTVLIGKEIFKTEKLKRTIDVSKSPYNAIGDGATLNTLAIQKALDDCTDEERVVIPKGVFLCGGLKIKSNTELYLEEGAILQGSENPEDYLPKIWSRFEGVERFAYQSLINVGELKNTGEITVENVKIHGKGSIIGGGFNLLCNTCGIVGTTEGEKRKALTTYQVDLDSKTAHRERGRLINVSNGKNVVIDGLNLGNSPSWNLHFIYSKDIITCGCNIFSTGIWNGDGWDPDSSENCVIFDSVFNTGDDCIAIKSGKNPEGNILNVPCKNIDVFSCRAKIGYSHGIAIGSEISGGVEKVRFWDCDFTGTYLGLHIKTTEKRGGYIKDVEVLNSKISRVTIRQVGYNDDGEGADSLTEISDIRLENVIIEYTSDDPGFGYVDVDSYIYVNGFEKDKEKFRNIAFKGVKIVNTENLKEYDVSNCSNVVYNGKRLVQSDCMRKTVSVEEGVNRLIETFQEKVDENWEILPKTENDYTPKLKIGTKIYPIFYWREDPQVQAVVRNGKYNIGNSCSAKISGQAGKAYGIESFLYKELDCAEWILDSELKKLTAYYNKNAVNVVLRMKNDKVATLELGATLPFNAEEQVRHTVWGSLGMESSRVISTQERPQSVYLYTDRKEAYTFNDTYNVLYGLTLNDSNLAVAVYKMITGKIDLNWLKLRNNQLIDYLNAVKESSYKEKSFVFKEV